MAFSFFLLFEFHIFPVFDGYVGINWKEKNCRIFNLARDHCHPWFVLNEFLSNKFLVQQMFYLFPVCPTNYYNILIMD
jgi:hypothetical protein